MAQIILDSNNNLIQGDFDNATLNNRTKLQTTTTNATTNVYVVPNGSSTSAGVSVANNSSLTNASKIVMATNGSTDTQIISGINGSGTYLPLSFYTNNTLAMQLDTSGNLIVTGTVDMGSSFMRNRIINGAMVISQRNGTATTTITNGSDFFGPDRWKYYRDVGGTFTTAQSSTAPTGFVNSMLTTASTGASPSAAQLNFVQQIIEGFNVADLGWGTANAQTITLSFWVRSSITGTYAIGISNDGLNRAYVATYTINAANTWEQKSITIAGDTSGTWLTTNGVGIRVYWDLGSGSNYNLTAGTWGGTWGLRTSGSTTWGATTGATFLLTGVQLEVGSIATPFERRMYTTELQLCQRYCLKLGNDGATYYTPYGFVTNTTSTGGLMVVQFPTTMRATPTLVSTTPNRIISGSVNNSVSSITLGDGSGSAVYCDYVSTGLTIGQSGFIGANGSLTARLLFAAEL